MPTFPVGIMCIVRTYNQCSHSQDHQSQDLGACGVSNGMSNFDDMVESILGESDLPFDQSGELEGWIAHYNGKRLEIRVGVDADSLWGAMKFAIQTWKVPKSKQGLVSVNPAYHQ